MVVDTQTNVLKKIYPAQPNPSPGRFCRARDRAVSEFFSLPDFINPDWEIGVRAEGNGGPLFAVSGDSTGEGVTTETNQDIPEVGTPDNPDPDPDDIPNELKHALKFKEKNKLDRAEELFRSAMNRYPDNHNVHFQYGQFLEASEDFENAYRSYVKALLSTENPKKSPAWERREALLPDVNELDSETVGRVNLKLKLLERNAGDSTSKKFMEEINLEHIHHPPSGASIALPCGTRHAEGEELEISSGENDVISGINEAISYVSEALIVKEHITVDDIKRVHEKAMEPVCPSAAGKFRAEQVYVGHYVPPPPADVEHLMEELVAILEDQRTRHKHPIHTAAFAHYRLINIQPFEDGNSRTARLLMNLVLRKYKYPPIHIKTDERGEYREHLQTAHEGDIRPFLRFIAQAAESTIDDYLAAMLTERFREL